MKIIVQRHRAADSAIIRNYIRKSLAKLSAETTATIKVLTADTTTAAGLVELKTSLRQEPCDLYIGEINFGTNGGSDYNPRYLQALRETNSECIIALISSSSIEPAIQMYTDSEFTNNTFVFYGPSISDKDLVSITATLKMLNTSEDHKARQASILNRSMIGSVRMLIEHTVAHMQAATVSSAVVEGKALSPVSAPAPAPAPERKHGSGLAVPSYIAKPRPSPRPSTTSTTSRHTSRVPLSTRRTRSRPSEKKRCKESCSCISALVRAWKNRGKQKVYAAHAETGDHRPPTDHGHRRP